MRKADRRKNIVILGICILTLVIVLGTFYSRKYEKHVLAPATQKIVVVQKPRTVQMYVPAVNNEGKGVVTLLKVGIEPGTGKVLVNVNQILFWVDTQQSIQIAKRVAQKITGVDLSKYDLIYSIQTNASLIEGPSAGAALTIATIAAIENKTLNNSVMITGTIKPDGTIGPVGGIIPKAQAAKSVGAKIFLVPKGQGTQTNYVPEEHCEHVGSFTFCTTTYKEEKENVGKSVGIEVKEVSNISQALKYFFG